MLYYLHIPDLKIGESKSVVQKKFSLFPLLSHFFKLSRRIQRLNGHTTKSYSANRLTTQQLVSDCILRSTRTIIRYVEWTICPVKGQTFAYTVVLL